MKPVKLRLFVKAVTLTDTKSSTRWGGYQNLMRLAFFSFKVSPLDYSSLAISLCQGGFWESPNKENHNRWLHDLLDKNGYLNRTDFLTIKVNILCLWSCEWLCNPRTVAHQALSVRFSARALEWVTFFSKLGPDRKLKSINTVMNKWQGLAWWPQ